MSLSNTELKIKKSPFHVFFDWFAGIVFIGMVVFWLFNLSSLPSEVPMHYNAKGEIDRYGSKWETIILPFISVFLWVMCYFIEKHPSLMNIPKKLTKENEKEIFTISTHLLSVIKNFSLLIFSFLIFEICWTAKGNEQLLSSWFLPVILLVTFVPIIYYSIKLVKVK